jgi:hypothetical protein
MATTTTDSEIYGGANTVSINDAMIDLPPLTTVWLAKKTSTQKGTKSTKKKTSKSSKK